MTSISPPNQTVGGAGVPVLTLLEQRVTNELLTQIANTSDNNINTLRNDEATVLGVPVPVVSA